MPLPQGRRLKPWVAAAAMIAPVSFLAAIPWLKQQQSDALVYLCAGVAALVCIAASFVLAILSDRELDEWHRRAARFSNQWGWLGGAGIVGLLLAVPPVQDLTVATAAAFSDGGAADRQQVLLTFTFAFMVVVFTQSLCTVVLRMIWQRWMSRPAA